MTTGEREEMIEKILMAFTLPYRNDIRDFRKKFPVTGSITAVLACFGKSSYCIAKDTSLILIGDARGDLFRFSIEHDSPLQVTKCRFHLCIISYFSHVKRLIIIISYPYFIQVSQPVYEIYICGNQLVLLCTDGCLRVTDLQGKSLVSNLAVGIPAKQLSCATVHHGKVKDGQHPVTRANFYVT